MTKIKVLVVPSDRTGVGYFRSTKPHISLEQNYPDEFHVDIDFAPKLNDDNWLKHTLVTLKDDEVSIAYKDVDLSRWEPKPRVY